jgi:replication initiation and membrane attachment protein
MKTIQSQDFIQIRLESMLSHQDLEFVTEFYGPLMSLEAIGLYMTLRQYEGLLDQQPLLLQTWLTMLQSSPQQFQQARIQLEALGLLRTYQQDYAQTKLFVMSVFAPKNPFDFFNDPLLKGLLLQRLGTVALKRLETKYATSAIASDAKEVSASFGEVFHPDLHHPAFLLSSHTNVKGKTLAEIRKPFDRLQFAEQLKIEFSLDPQKLHPDDLDAAVNIASLVGIDELAMANLFGTLLDANHRLNLPALEKAARQEKRLPFVRQRQQQKYQFQETSSHAVLVNQLEMMTPVEFLTSRQQGAEVSPADFSLLMRLANHYRLANPVINALIYHVLTTQNNVLSSRYVEKVAATLTREKDLQHASDVLDYFYRISLPKTYPSKPYANKGASKAEASPAAASVTTNPEISDEEIQALETKLKGLK